MATNYKEWEYLVFGLILLVQLAMKIVIVKKLIDQRSSAFFRNRSFFFLMLEAFGGCLIVVTICFREMYKAYFPCALLIYCSVVFMGLYYLPSILQSLRFYTIFSTSLTPTKLGPTAYQYQGKNFWGSSSAAHICWAIFFAVQVFSASLVFAVDENNLMMMDDISSSVDDGDMAVPIMISLDDQHPSIVPEEGDMINGSPLDGDGQDPENVVSALPKEEREDADNILRRSSLLMTEKDSSKHLDDDDEQLHADKTKRNIQLTIAREMMEEPQHIDLDEEATPPKDALHAIEKQIDAHPPDFHRVPFPVMIEAELPPNEPHQEEYAQASIAVNDVTFPEKEGAWDQMVHLTAQLLPLDLMFFLEDSEFVGSVRAKGAPPLIDNKEMDPSTNSLIDQKKMIYSPFGVIEDGQESSVIPVTNRMLLQVIDDSSRSIRATKKRMNNGGGGGLARDHNRPHHKGIFDTMDTDSYENPRVCFQNKDFVVLMVYASVYMLMGLVTSLMNRKIEDPYGRQRDVNRCLAVWAVFTILFFLSNLIRWNDDFPSSVWIIVEIFVADWFMFILPLHDPKRNITKELYEFNTTYSLIVGDVAEEVVKSLVEQTDGDSWDNRLIRFAYQYHRALKNETFAAQNEDLKMLLYGELASVDNSSTLTESDGITSSSLNRTSSVVLQPSINSDKCSDTYGNSPTQFADLCKTLYHEIAKSPSRLASSRGIFYRGVWVDTRTKIHLDQWMERYIQERYSKVVAHSDITKELASFRETNAFIRALQDQDLG